ncbi:MAG: flavodoxin-dependent (E)-4-hydroxy-3-methylbut-2-enyl-diphosphate synthase, partial [Candidatus Omnitrophota bacterium]
LAQEVETRAMKLEGPLTIAVMGCAVNGPGEAQGSDFAITGGQKKGMIYVAGKQERVVDEEHLVDELFKEIEKHRAQRSTHPV